MFTVYAEKEIFENIVVFSEVTPNWYKIFSEHSEVCLNMTKTELDAELVQGTPIFEFIMANGGKEPTALNDFFELIYEDNTILLEKPRSAFFLKYPKSITDSLQVEYGMIIQSIDSVNDDVLTGSFKRKLLKNELIYDNQHKGWKSLLKFKFPPSNSIVISDNFLLSSTEKVGMRNIDSGKENILWMLDTLLPTHLAIDYHITIISEDKNKTEVWRNKISTELSVHIKSLREYNISVEVVFIKSENLHERVLIMNYINSSSEHGFCIFKAKDGQTVNFVNKIQIQSYFSSLSNNQGESEYIIANKDLTVIKTECQALTTHIKAGTQIYRGAILGDCNPDKSLKNRLINDV